MPEGPSIVILRESVQAFNGKKVLAVSGNTKIDKKVLVNKKVIGFKSWGKHFLIDFGTFYVRIHFMLFGSYSINEKKENRKIRLGLKFKNGELNFYTCSVLIGEQNVNKDYNWQTDVMSEEWDPAYVYKQIKLQPERMVCDVLMDQTIFTGVGNIIKNEVLYRIKVHPESRVGSMSPTKIKTLIRQASKYSFEFYEWKKVFVLSKQWKIYKQKLCTRCDIKPEIKNTGLGKRKSYYCENCQDLYK